MKFYQAADAAGPQGTIYRHGWESLAVKLKDDYAAITLVNLRADDWMVKETRPAITLTPENVGRTVRLSSGRIAVITIYDPEDDTSWYAGGRWFDISGDDGDLSIIELL